MKRIPIGIDDFKRLIEDNYYFIDKSMFIKEFWNDGNVVLINRPRRFGKTLNMSMLKYFFDNKENNRELFEGLEIYNDEEIMKLQGKFPVIYLSFRGCSAADFKTTKELIIGEIRSEILAVSGFIKDFLNEDYIKELERIKLMAKDSDAVAAIKNLSELMFLAYKIKPIIIIDEYDNPINNAYVKGFYEEVIGFLKPFYENTLKSNNFMERACITGVLRVAKESIFSGLNNLKVSSILSNRYSNKFGFEEHEVRACLDYYGIEYKMDEVKNYYNGYVIGKSEIFNPWSIVNYADYMLNEEWNSKDFWINTSSNDIIRNLMESNPESYKKDIETLLKGDTIYKSIDESTAFKYLSKKSSIPWSLMLFSGYLKVTALGERKNMYLKIPNKEVRNIYQDVVLEWVTNNYDEADYDSLISDLLNGDVEDFSEKFKEMIFSTMSFFDPSGEKPENFYHGFVLGLLALLIDTYEIKYNIKSNREAGKGRADIMIIPRDKSKLGVILEFKKAGSEETLIEEAEDAINQIYEKKYYEELKSLGIDDIMKVGISFFGKVCEVVWE